MNPVFKAGHENELEHYFTTLGVHSKYILCDSNTKHHCLQALYSLFPAWTSAPVICIPAGEENKNIQQTLTVWEQLHQWEVSRNSILINLGGGMISDLGGFVASVFKRGIPFLNIPTTLLAMCDAAFGGKTGIDFLQVKNELGILSNATATYINPVFLSTLPLREKRSGLAEVFKHALLDSPLAFQHVQQKTENEFYQLASIQQAYEFKLSCTQQDPTDQGIRQQLNFGHSLGHAIESCSMNTPNPLLHGEAIMLGMEWELKLSEQLLHCDPLYREELITLKKNYFPALHFECSFESLWPYLVHDKKNKDGIRMSLLRSAGDCAWGFQVQKESLQKLFDA
ncbi:MAG TPA: 3-dehydroquinate synthase family protein [Chitinophagaceae bacterium]|nr:3-dehydroquinate synthase family protein [Chitinophagaceae bacterium]HNF72028.1 3-dehydroquinate synthase family protein [Chitinophagaceae bacterium]